MNTIIGNILSFLGGLLDFLFGLKYNKKLIILKGNLISSTLSLIAYIFLGAFDGVIDCIVTLLRLLTIYFKEKFNKKFRVLFVVFLLLYALVFFKFSGVQTILLFLSAMCSFIPKWMSKDMQVIRVGGLCSNMLMIFYNIAISNYAVISIQVLNIMLITITIIKWSKKRKEKRGRIKTMRRRLAGLDSCPDKTKNNP